MIHTFATLALQNSMNVKNVFDMLGDYSAVFALDTCGNISIQMLKDVAQKAGRFLQQNLQ